ncbi:hypothetical protein CROQUDRAFT_649845 [Cronartium quercuum f. sp. fusiforme G11]|uniref:Aquaporin n=1 Tax=Cronartium quercuum f. sp. fusiforme G11 TaxID=708437 RepID=A0A9P6NS61_9BASI|nr:hypothetical protein CROQUDRAFT_649845 [Cronartium quercuum f. sp. fusiforme G11]
MVWFLGIFMISLSTANLGIHGSAYLAISVAIAVALLVHILGPLTGGHINPIVTLSTCITGLTPPTKGMAYMSAQMTGATIGGILLVISLGPRSTAIENYGCYFNPSPSFNVIHASVFEFMGTFAIISMMYGFGINAGATITQGGPKLSPLLNGITLGVYVFAASGFAPENSYLGTVGFPARCWATSVGTFKFKATDWIYWIPSILASIAHGLAYRFLNPFGEPKVGTILGHDAELGSSREPKVIIQIDGPQISKTDFAASASPRREKAFDGPQIGPRRRSIYT